MIYLVNFFFRTLIAKSEFQLMLSFLFHLRITAPSGTVKLLDPSLVVGGSSLKHNETLSKLLLQQDDGVLKDDNVSTKHMINEHAC